MALSSTAQKILELVQELQTYKTYRENLLQRISKIDLAYKQKIIDQRKYNQLLSDTLKDKTYQEWQDYYSFYINDLVRQTKDQISIFYSQLNIKTEIRKPTTTAQKKELPTIDKQELKDFIEEQKHAKKIKVIQKKEYSIYTSKSYAKFSNQVVEKLTFYLIKKYPKFFEPLSRNLNLADIKIFSKTYISMTLFSSIVAFPVVAIITALFTFNIGTALLYSFFAVILTFFGFYLYPNTIIGGRNRKIKNDLVFAIVHMAAISGSGAQPIKIFRLLIESGEYRHINTEIRRILNYSNLFGYSFSTSLRAVAATTSSYELKELLNGMVATIETGGDLKDYLKDKAEDTLNSYRLEQEKYTQKLATYSDIYTAVLVAAPLLFLVTLTILDKIAPTLGSFSIAQIASVGTYLGIPLVNIAFIVFLNLTSQEI